MVFDLEGYSFYIRPGITDMRKGSHGLSYIVQEHMKLKPFGRSVFLFCGRSRRIVKAIVWDRNGWVEVTKRLECGSSFKWPESQEDAMKVDASTLVQFLRGNDVWRTLPEFTPECVG